MAKLNNISNTELFVGNLNLNNNLKPQIVAENLNKSEKIYDNEKEQSNVVTGDSSKSIKSVGELALRISKFDSYRLFTLYEDIRSRKLMDVSGDQRYYLVFKSPKKEIRIPEYDPKGFFQVDKVNGCILFKITKKNAEDILSMKTAGEKIFHIIRVFEERDIFGKVINVTDEVEVYNGKWGDDYEFSTFSTANKIDLLTKALAAQVDKNANLLKEYSELLEKYNDEVVKTSEFEKEIEKLRANIDLLNLQLNEYTGNTHDGTLLSTDTKYIAFENTMNNVSFSEVQLSEAIIESMKDNWEIDNTEGGEPMISLNVIVNEREKGLTIITRKNDKVIGSSTYDQELFKTVDVKHNDIFEFNYEGPSGYRVVLGYKDIAGVIYQSSVSGDDDFITVIDQQDKKIKVQINLADSDSDLYDIVGNVMTLECKLEKIIEDENVV